MALGATPGCWGCGFTGAALEEGPDKVLGPLVPACHWARVELGPMNTVLLLAGGQ